MSISKRKIAFPLTALLLAILAFFLLGRWHESGDRRPAASQTTELPDPGTGKPTPPPDSAKLPEASNPGASENCPETASESEEFRELSQFMERHAADMARRLAYSSDPEHLLTASYLIRFRDLDGSLHFLSRALELSPSGALALRTLLALCLDHPDTQECATLAIDQRAMSADGQNGTLLIAIAARRAKRGDLRGALDAMNLAATAPLFDSHYSEQVLAADRALSAVSDLRTSERLVVALGTVPVPLEHAAFQLCRDRIDSSSEWRHVCLAVASRMENDGDTLITQLLGSALQALIHRIDGDTLEADAADHRREVLRKTAVDTAGVLDKEMFLRNPQLVNRYLGALTSHGEAEAAAFIQEEYARIQETHGDQCTP